MRVLLAAAITIDGKMTLDSQPGSSWTSREDQQFFQTLKTEVDVIVMGRKTWEVIKDSIVPSTRPIRYIMSHSITHRSTRDTIIFTDLTPSALYEEFLHKKYDTILIAGGSEINSLWLTHHLVDELYITIEPYLAGSGVPFMSTVKGFLDTYHLTSMKQLNTTGTILLHYSR